MCWFSSRILRLVCLFRQKTAYEVRSSDWSSDVWFSDLLVVELLGADRIAVRQVDAGHAEAANGRFDVARVVVAVVAGQAAEHVLQRGLREGGDAAIGRAACGDRVCQLVYISRVPAAFQKRPQCYRGHNNKVL